jgi:hypothetical protein
MIRGEARRGEERNGRIPSMMVLYTVHVQRSVDDDTTTVHHLRPGPSKVYLVAAHDGERGGGRVSVRILKRTGPSEKYYVRNTTIKSLSLCLFSLPFSPSPPPPLMVSSPLLSQPRFVTHPAPSDLSSLFPPLHITSARFRPHMLAACYPS